MKKYVAGIFAVLIAIGLSAFSYPSKPKQNNKQDALYWYTIDGSNNLNVLQNSSGALTKADAMSGIYSITNCPDNSAAPLCLVGTDSPNDHGIPVGSPDVDHRIKNVFVP